MVWVCILCCVGMYLWIIGQLVYLLMQCFGLYLGVYMFWVFGQLVFECIVFGMVVIWCFQLCYLMGGLVECWFVVVVCGSLYQVFLFWLKVLGFSFWCSFCRVWVMCFFIVLVVMFWWWVICVQFMLLIWLSRYILWQCLGSLNSVCCNRDSICFDLVWCSGFGVVQSGLVVLLLLVSGRCVCVCGDCLWLVSWLCVIWYSSRCSFLLLCDWQWISCFMQFWVMFLVLFVLVLCECRKVYSGVCLFCMNVVNGLGCGSGFGLQCSRGDGVDRMEF